MTDSAKENARTTRTVPERVLWCVVLVVLAPFMFRTWERWNVPSKTEVALVFLGMALWGWVFWTVVNAL